ncbi:MAG: hypothetical protein DRP42_01440 [Tenericutes bacterium]|nr:MAG: hypothetical protein DRP42_01440 [Mycoplasmatota bacterium]
MAEKAEQCCQLVGNLEITGIDACLFSVSYSSSTEVSLVGDCIIKGPTLGNVSISGPASTIIHSGCAVKAGVQIPWIRKYDCDNNDMVFILTGHGKSFISGDTVPPGIRLLQELHTYPVMSADSGSGPASIYSDTTQTDGHGLEYLGTPIPFITNSAGVIQSNIGVGTGDMYLQSFNVSYNPGAIPVASYSFVFFIPEGEE